MRRAAALLALLAMASSSTAALAQGRALGGAVAAETALSEVDATTTGHAGSVVWTQKDPLGFEAGDTSLYVYAFGDPISFVDPSGELCFIPLAFFAIKAAMFAWNAYETYQLLKKLMDPCISQDDKLAELALLGLQWAGGAIIGKLLNALKGTKYLAKFGCFAAGTLVATSTGLVPIETIEPGATVQSRNDSTGDLEWRTVIANHARREVPTLAIGIEDEREGSWQLTTTMEHPISVASVGYVPAARLEPGQWLVTESGAWSRVVSVAPTGATDTVYNLTVDGTANYFVGPSPVLVHNIFDCDDLSRAAGAADRNGLTKAGRALQKHGDRPGSAFPQTKGGPPKLNPAGQGVVDDILTTPGSVNKGNRFGGVDVVAPDGRGRPVRFERRNDGTPGAMR